MIKKDQAVPGEVSLQIVDEATIEELNLEYRSKQEPTDVLSFPQMEVSEIKTIVEGILEGSQSTEEKEEGFHDSIQDEANYLMLGDVVIWDRAISEQANAYGHSFERELAFLFLHGLLHLLGYDHDNEVEKEEMFSLQENILDSIGITR